jgi:hypothetical protein
VAVSQAASGIRGYCCNCPNWTANSKGVVNASGSEKAKRFGRVASVAIVWSRNGDER